MSDLLATAIVIGLIVLAGSFFLNLGVIGTRDIQKAREIEAQARELEKQRREG